MSLRRPFGDQARAVESSMTHISGHDRAQIFLLPEAVDDYVGVDNPVRFIDAFVDELDLAAAGFVRVEAKGTGRPGYAPADLLKLYIYGYLNRVRSSRRLELESHRNIEVIWLLRSLKPDFKTIADFRRDNRAAFRSVFRQFVLLCRRLDLYGRELLAVDGTRIKGHCHTQNPRYDFCSRKLFRLEGGSSALFVSRSGRRRCAMPCDDSFDRIPRLFGAFWPRLHRPHHQVGASEGENAALVIMTFLA